MAKGGDSPKTPTRRRLSLGILLVASEYLVHKRARDPRAGVALPQRISLRKRSALPITDTELNVIAALAIIGLSNKPKTG